MNQVANLAGQPASAIKVLLFDIGGVVLSNGWDQGARRRACEHFDLDGADFEDRHDFVSGDFEIGKLTLSQYLRRTIFYRERPFSEDAFFDFMKEQSVPLSETLDLLGELSASGRYVLATLNNESRELNDYRIDRFELRDHFSIFLSSCYVGVKKPDQDIYRLAVDLTQHAPNECVFIDDRELNLECANRAGIQSIHFKDAAQLRADLDDLGVSL
ncbi:MAG: HAD family phosphatase [Actinomycetia bacterium]|nr:HAD family phosphatase [Actinomycetes bacterium]